MFTIDLLKGQGIPLKHRPQGIAITVVALLVPVVILIAMVSFYMSNQVSINVVQQRIARCDESIIGLAREVQLQKEFNDQKNTINLGLKEVAGNIGNHMQWSPVILEIVQNLPKNVKLKRLEGHQSMETRKIAKKGSPGTKVDTTVLIRRLHVSVSGNISANCDQAVKDFREKLYGSEVIGKLLEDVRVSQEYDNINGGQMVSYQIDCIFKPVIK